jgi:predicted small integral membrane protein
MLGARWEEAMTLQGILHFLWWFLAGLFVVCAGDWFKKWQASGKKKSSPNE